MDNLSAPCPVESPIPDGLGGCLSCLACSSLSHPPSECTKCDDELSTASLLPVTSTWSHVTSIFTGSSTIAVDQVSSSIPVVELTIAAVLLVLVIVSGLFFYLRHKRKQNQRCENYRYEQCQTCVNGAKNKTTTEVRNGNAVAIDIGNDENDRSIANTEFDQPHSQDSLPAESSGHGLMDDVSHRICCSSARGDGYPTHDPTQIAHEDDKNCETLPS
ncbi:uncharacterized protein LOC144435039 [Glandiceps talaboti]